MPYTSIDGKICYLEIPAKDIQQSANFYKAVFRWNFRTRGDGATAFDDTTGQVSGAFVLNRPPSTIQGIVIYIMVDNMQTTINSILANGGKITQSVGADAPEITARFADPAGNIFGLYQEPNLHSKGTP